MIDEICHSSIVPHKEIGDYVPRIFEACNNENSFGQAKKSAKMTDTQMATKKQQLTYDVQKFFHKLEKDMVMDHFLALHRPFFYKVR
jgi:hypothetical protein